MTTIVVCGGRDFADRGLLYRALDIVRAELDVDRIAHGACGVDRDGSWQSSFLRGADKLADAWAAERGLAVAWYPVPWKSCGNDASRRSKAAKERVILMFSKEDPVACVAFPGDRGTQMTMGVARAFKVATRYVPSMRSIEEKADA